MRSFDPLSQPPKFAMPVPIFRIFDEALARSFYIDFLGFRVKWEHRFAPNKPLYAEIARGGAVLHLSGHHGDASPGAAAYLPGEGLSAFRDSLHAKRHPNARPEIETRPWGDEMIVIAPFSNRLRFCEER